MSLAERFWAGKCYFIQLFQYLEGISTEHDSLVPKT